MTVLEVVRPNRLGLAALAPAKPEKYTVFDNTRAVSETGLVPAPFSEYSYPLLKFSKEHRFQYPYQEWPSAARESAG